MKRELGQHCVKFKGSKLEEPLKKTPHGSLQEVTLLYHTTVAGSNFQQIL